LNEAQNIFAQVSILETISTLTNQPMDKQTCGPDKQPQIKVQNNDS